MQTQWRQYLTDAFAAQAAIARGFRHGLRGAPQPPLPTPQMFGVRKVGEKPAYHARTLWQTFPSLHKASQKRMCSIMGSLGSMLEESVGNVV